MGDKRPRSEFEELEAQWYQRLRDEKFPEIENTTHPDRPLKVWHSTEFVKHASRNRRAMSEEYYMKADEFFHSFAFQEARQSVASSHGNRDLRNVVNESLITDVFELHVEGLSERQIAADLRLAKTTVHDILKAMREWMKIT